MDSRLLEALRLAELGLAVHWLHPRSKEPIGEKWQEAPAAHRELLAATHRLGYELGIHCGRVLHARVPVVVLDLDGQEALEWARAHLPRSPVRAWTRRGEHWYFAHPGGAVGTRHHPDRLLLDVQAEGAHVVCPPSIHPTGYVYQWFQAPTEASLAALPTWSREWFPPPAAPVIVQSASRVGKRELARARGAARKWRVHVEGEGRGTQTYKLAQFLTLQLGLSEADAYRVLAAEWNPRLPQPYDELKLRRKVREALRSRLAASCTPGTPILERVPR